jgi:hypothetical protein
MRMHEIWKRRCSNATLRHAYADVVMLLHKNVWLCFSQWNPQVQSLSRTLQKNLDLLIERTHKVKSKCDYLSLNPNSSWNPCDISAIYYLLTTIMCPLSSAIICIEPAGPIWSLHFAWSPWTPLGKCFSRPLQCTAQFLVLKKKSCKDQLIYIGTHTGC